MAGRPGFPHQWYWIADDGRVYSAALQKVVDKSDPGYREFVASGRAPTFWPRERGTGPQTEAELFKVLGQHGLSLTPHEALSKYAREKHAAISSGGTLVNLNPVGQKPHIVEVDTSTRGLSILHTDFMHAQGNPHETFHLHQSTGLSVQLNADQLKTAHKAATSFVRHSSRALASVLHAISQKKITSKEQIDNPPAEVTNWPVNP